MLHVGLDSLNRTFRNIGSPHQWDRCCSINHVLRSGKITLACVQKRHQHGFICNYHYKILLIIFQMFCLILLVRMIQTVNFFSAGLPLTQLVITRNCQSASKTQEEIATVVMNNLSLTSIIPSVPFFFGIRLPTSNASFNENVPSISNSVSKDPNVKKCKRNFVGFVEILLVNTAFLLK